LGGQLGHLLFDQALVLVGVPLGPGRTFKLK
jgi:hypothetical protein